MAGAKEVVGFIFECGRDGPDFKVCRHLLGKLNVNIEMVARFLDNKQRLLSECGTVAAVDWSADAGRAGLGKFDCDDAGDADPVLSAAPAPGRSRWQDHRKKRA